MANENVEQASEGTVNINDEKTNVVLMERPSALLNLEKSKGEWDTTTEGEEFMMFEKNGVKAELQFKHGRFYGVMDADDKGLHLREEIGSVPNKNKAKEILALDISNASMIEIKRFVMEIQPILAKRLGFDQTERWTIGEMIHETWKKWGEPDVAATKVMFAEERIKIDGLEKILDHSME